MVSPLPDTPGLWLPVDILSKLYPCNARCRLPLEALDLFNVKELVVAGMPGSPKVGIRVLRGYLGVSNAKVRGHSDSPILHNDNKSVRCTVHRSYDYTHGSFPRARRIQHTASCSTRAISYSPRPPPISLPFARGSTCPAEPPSRAAGAIPPGKKGIPAR